MCGSYVTYMKESFQHLHRWLVCVCVCALCVHVRCVCDRADADNFGVGVSNMSESCHIYHI